ncbi:MAG: Re/Si-specific NAD(P)(+) transhydrogenase subunit alpha [Myxococcales bacterium]|nr:Re/Si-specific NAD(P)(+) transhydrogenase subunit alpha [Myxococcales bacterium]
MRIAIVRESFGSERRVAATPDSCSKLISLGFLVTVEAGAGDAACFPDSSYLAVGAHLSTDLKELYGNADILLKVRPLGDRPDVGSELPLLRRGATVVSFLWPARNGELLQAMASHGLTAIAMDQVPRISRAQKLDALSSMANISGYRAIVEAASHFGSFFTGQITAAGKVAPAKVLVIGAGVAGLSALGAAKGLGAVVRAFDTRSAVREQVQSMGAEFLEVTLQEDGDGAGGYAKEMSPAFIAAEMQLFRDQASEVDIVVTTALIPGKPAPKLWLTDMVERMKPGSVIVDLAAESGGNCEVTIADQVVIHKGVTVVGPTDLPSRLATTASQLYAQNLVHLLKDLGGAAAQDPQTADFALNFDDEVVYGATVVHRGQLVWPRPAKASPSATGQPANQGAKPVPATAVVKGQPPTATGDGHATAAAGKTSGSAEPFRKQTLVYADRSPGSERGTTAKRAALTWVMAALLTVAYGVLKAQGTDLAEDPVTLLFLERLTVFVLACFVGWQVVWNVTPALHTPLMSVTNAISGIILVGGLLHSKGPVGTAPVLLGLAAVLFATINVAGGFLVTRRMLRMFRK